MKTPHKVIRHIREEVTVSAETRSEALEKSKSAKPDKSVVTREDVHPQQSPDALESKVEVTINPDVQDDGNKTVAKGGGAEAKPGPKTTKKKTK